MPSASGTKNCARSLRFKAGNCAVSAPAVRPQSRSSTAAGVVEENNIGKRGCWREAKEVTIHAHVAHMQLVEITFFRIPLDPIFEGDPYKSDVVRSPSLKDPVILARNRDEMPTRGSIMRKRVLTPVLRGVKRSPPKGAQSSRSSDPDLDLDMPAVTLTSPIDVVTPSPGDESSAASSQLFNSPDLLSPPGGGSPPNSARRQRLQGTGSNGSDDPICELLAKRVRRKKKKKKRSPKNGEADNTGALNSNGSHCSFDSESTASPLPSPRNAHRETAVDSETFTQREKIGERTPHSREENPDRVSREGNPDRVSASRARTHESGHHPSASVGETDPGGSFTVDSAGNVVSSHPPPPVVLVAATQEEENDDDCRVRHFHGPPCVLLADPPGEGFGYGRPRKKKMRDPGSPRKRRSNWPTLRPGLIALRPLHGSSTRWRSWSRESAARSASHERGNGQVEFAYPIHIARTASSESLTAMADFSTPSESENRQRDLPPSDHEKLCAASGFVSTLHRPRKKQKKRRSLLHETRPAGNPGETVL